MHSDYLLRTCVPNSRSFGHAVSALCEWQTLGFINIDKIIFLPSCKVFKLLLFLQDKRISCADALTHPYMDEGRLRYHSCMCRCCQTTPAGRQYVNDFEPVSPHIFDDCFEKDLTSVHQVRGILLLSKIVSPVILKL